MSSQSYLLLRCEIAGSCEDDLPEALAGLAVLGCEVGEASSGMLPLRIYLTASAAADEPLLARALGHLGGGIIGREELPERDWLAAYRSAVCAFPVGGLWWLDPHPESPSAAPDGRVSLVVEPRMAFGTGSHESTQLVLLELEEMQLEGASVLDVGTGSGILSLASLHRGARWAVGLDNDPQAVWVARQIAAQQRPPLAPSYLAASVDCLAGGSFQAVLCNMISEQFLPLAAAVRQLLAESGVAVFSGILAHEASAVRGELAQRGFAVVAERQLGEWRCLRAVAA